MSEDWKKELESMKKETEEEVEKVREEESKLREKHEGEKEKLVELIYAQLKPVEETFKVKGADKNQPRLDKYPHGVTLYLPIDHANVSIYFGFTLTDKGYALTVRREVFDSQKERTFYFDHYIQAPVTVEGINKEIREFVRDRNDTVKRVEEKARRRARKYG